MSDIAAQIIEETVRRCQALHEYAGRSAWEHVIRDVIQKHLVAMLAMERRDKWEPIETLPFNERVLVWNREVGLHTYVALDEFWREDWEFTDFEPTHWQPLPSPPGASE